MLDPITKMPALEVARTDGVINPWQEICPATSRFSGIDGRIYTLPDPQALVNHLNSIAADERIPDVFLDINHRIERTAGEAEDTPAAGWFKEFRVSPDLFIEGRLELNQIGTEKVADKQYKYLSPAIDYDPRTGVIVGINSVSLTNNPNFYMRALHDARKHPKHREDTIMIERLRKLFGLQDTATEDEICTRAERALNDAKVLGEIAPLMKLEGDMTVEAFQRALNDAGKKQPGAAAATPSLTDFVPRADYDALKIEVSELGRALNDRALGEHKSQVETLIARGLNERKISPGTAEYHRGRMKTAEDITEFQKFLGDAPELAPNQMARAHNDAGSGKPMSAIEAEVCASLGVDTAAYLKNR